MTTRLPHHRRPVRPGVLLCLACAALVAAALVNAFCALTWRC